MINIIETAEPLKVSGKTSFLVTFPYNALVVEALKNLPNYYYHKKDYIWEVPANNLSKLLDSLTFLDDIQLTLCDTSEIDPISFKPITDTEINSLGFAPYKHQVEGINYGLDKKKWLLLDNPGCGKTNQIIGLAETLYNRKIIDHCLIIVGINSLKSNWRKEIKKFGKQNCIIIGERWKRDGTVSKTPASIVERVDQLKQPISEFFVIINVESFRDERILKAIQSGPNTFGMIALDECHRILATGKSSTQGTNILKLKSGYSVAATGTLLVNNPVNLWGPLSWIQVDHSTLTMFKSQYCKFGGFNNSQVVGFKDLDLLKDELESCSLRRSKEQLVDLPPKTVTVELLDMNDDHRKFYDAIKQGVKEEADKIHLNSANLLALTTRLRQATACPGILTTQDIISTKVERACELVEELVSHNEKVVILSTFKQPVYQLAKLLEKYNPLICTGDQADSDVSNYVDLFQTDDKYPIIVGTLGKMSTGLTLNRASYMIMLDEHWTAAMNNQCHDRIYRLTNTTPAFITILACRDTIDERVHAVAQGKQDLSDFIIDDKVTPKFAETLKSILSEL